MDYETARKKPLGEGSRFSAVEEHARESGARDPAAVAAVAGREAHGAAKMAEYSAEGRAAAAKKRAQHSALQES